MLEVLLVVGVLFAGAVAATGRGGGLAPAPPDAAEVGLPEGRVGPADLSRLRFGLAFRGYRMAEVDGALDALAAALTSRDAELAECRERVTELERRSRGGPAAPYGAADAAADGADPVEGSPTDGRSPWPS